MGLPSVVFYSSSSGFSTFSMTEGEEWTDSARPRSSVAQHSVTRHTKGDALDEISVAGSLQLRRLAGYLLPSWPISAMLTALAEDRFVAWAGLPVEPLTPAGDVTEISLTPPQAASMAGPTPLPHTLRVRCWALATLQCAQEGTGCCGPSSTADSRMRVRLAPQPSLSSP